MKKMKLQMLGLSVNDLLSREQMKKVMGGSGGGSGGSGAQDCSMTYKDSSGIYHTEQGTCKEQWNSAQGGGYIVVPYCSTSSFPNPTNVSSNGGTSKCGSPYAS